MKNIFAGLHTEHHWRCSLLYHATNKMYLINQVYHCYMMNNTRKLLALECQIAILWRATINKI
jgi:hypothetical protein